MMIIMLVKSDDADDGDSDYDDDAANDETFKTQYMCGSFLLLQNVFGRHLMLLLSILPNES
jgi:hypothetical protein